MAASTTTTKRINLYQLSQEMSGAALRLVGVGDSTQPKTVKAPVATQAALDTAVAAHTFNAAIVPPPDAPLANQATVAAALATALNTDLNTAIADMDTAIAMPAVPAGTLTSAQLSNVSRQLEGALRPVITDLRAVMVDLKRLIRYVTNDFTGTG